MCKRVLHGTGRHVVFGTRQEDTLRSVVEQHLHLRDHCGEQSGVHGHLQSAELLLWSHVNRASVSLCSITSARNTIGYGPVQRRLISSIISC